MISWRLWRLQRGGCGTGLWSPIARGRPGRRGSRGSVGGLSNRWVTCSCWVSRPAGCASVSGTGSFGDMVGFLRRRSICPDGRFGSMSIEGVPRRPQSHRLIRWCWHIARRGFSGSFWSQRVKLLVFSLKRSISRNIDTSQLQVFEFPTE